MMRKALGKGIGAIITEETKSALAVETRPLRVEEISSNPYQPRHEVEENLDGLAASIKENGILQPVVVRRRAGGYELVMGERRLRAARLAGLATIPAIVREASDRDMLELALIENVQRTDLNPVDEALAYKRLADEFKFTHDEIARRVGKDRSTVTNAVRLLSLPFKVRDLIVARSISAGHARALLGLRSRVEQVELAERAARDGLSVRQIETICARQASPRRKTRREKDVHLRALEERLQEKLGTKVSIKEAPRGEGILVVHYHSAEDLERLVRLIAGRG